MVGFIFGGNTGDSYDTLQRKRKYIDALQAQILGRQPKTAAEGWGAILGSLGTTLGQSRLDAQEKAGTDAAISGYNSAVQKLYGQITGGNAPAPAGTASNSPATGAVDVAGLDQNGVYDGFMNTVKSKVTNPNALAAIASTGYAESGFDPKKAVATWNDPSESGAPGRSGGILSWRGPRYAALAATGDLSPEGQAKFFLGEDPDLIDRLNTARSPEEAQAMMNRAWAFAGYDRPGGEAGRRIARAKALVSRFQGEPAQVASLDPSIGMPEAAAAIQRTAPGSGYVDPQVTTASRPQPAPMQGPMPSPMQRITKLGTNQVLPNLMVDRFAQNPDFQPPEMEGPNFPVPASAPVPQPRPDQMATGSVPQPAPVSPFVPAAMRAPAQPLQRRQEIDGAPQIAAAQQGRPSAPAAPQAQPDQQVAQAQPTGQAQAAQSFGIDPAIIQQLNNPFLPPQYRASLQFAVQQQMEAAQQAREEQQFRARKQWEDDQRRADPAYQLGLEKSRIEVDNLKHDPGEIKVVGKTLVRTFRDGRVEDITPKDPGNPAGKFRFDGRSVEGQALNGLIDSGQLTEEQAQQLAAGKTVTDPSTGAISFMTPQSVFATRPPPQQQTVDLFGDNAAPQQQSVDLFGDQGQAQQPAPISQPPAVSPAPVPAAPNNGMIPLTAGKPSKQLSESERKNQSLFSVIKPELGVVEKNFDALTNPSNQAFSKMPFSEFATTPEYQQAANSLQTIVSSYLYSVSGATATPEEVRKQTDILTPRPGESKESIENKKRRIRTMVNAVAQAGSLPPLEEPAAPPAPAQTGARPRATNPQTGAVIEFDGTQWVPVK